MRTGAGFTSLSASPATPSPSATTPYAQHSPWHSPVPYLFGGLLAMMGLIAFALLILACSYWRLSGYPDSGDADPDRRTAGGDAKQTAAGAKSPPCFGEGFVVIMAGDEKPTFLATPISNRASLFADGCKVTAAKIEEGKETAAESAGSSESSGDQNREQ